jgi:MFS family permease
MLPAGFLLGALLGLYVEAYVGWRGLFAIGLLPAAFSLMIRAWVPESPHWLMRMGRLAERRQSLAWALMVDPREVELPAAAPPAEIVAWRELFKYPRSVAAGCLAGLSGTGFPVSGIWPRCDESAVSDRHHAKVYGKAAVGSPPMSVPHLDTRIIEGKKSLLFGPYARFSTKFLKHGSLTDLFRPITPGDIMPLLAVA